MLGQRASRPRRRRSVGAVRKHGNNGAVTPPQWRHCSAYKTKRRAPTTTLIIKACGGADVWTRRNDNNIIHNIIWCVCAVPVFWPVHGVFYGARLNLNWILNNNRASVIIKITPLLLLAPEEETSSKRTNNNNNHQIEMHDLWEYEREKKRLQNVSN